VNGTVFIAGLAPETTEDQIIQYFGQIGIVKRQKQKRGYPDQWPYKLKVGAVGRSVGQQRQKERRRGRQARSCGVGGGGEGGEGG
jgi:RNA recognition motif-containing protein